jgi:Domain of unknown function (DUF6766)
MFVFPPIALHSRKEKPMGRLWRNYNLSIVLTILFLTAWGLQTWMGWREFVAEEHTHNEAASWFGSGGYLWTWGQATFENWQSEFLQLLTFVTLTTFLIHRNSPESRDGDDEMKAQLERIEREMQRLRRLGEAHPREPNGDPGVVQRYARDERAEHERG